jgi:hypothetical protein
MVQLPVYGSSQLSAKTAKENIPFADRWSLKADGFSSN